ncbi:MAG: glycosyltransferase family 8 protein [Acutalibacteraceae bacterium]
MMESEVLRVVFSSDDNYARHMGAAIYSLLEHNGSFEKIRLYIIENEISAENKNKLEALVSGFENAEIIWFDFKKWLGLLKLNLAWNISLSSYARLFVSDMVEEDAEKVLYLDCDMIIQKSLKELWNVDMGEKTVAAVQDAVSDNIKNAVGMKPEEKYFNAGMLLINMKKWRENDTQNRCIDFINAHGGNVIHHDQGVLNGVLKDEKIILPLQYNVMTIHYVFDKGQINKYYKNSAEYYSEEEIENAKKDPVILHYTPSFTSRPWVKGCKHPLKQLYRQALEKTPWAGAKEEKDTSKLPVKLINFRYRHFPF